MSSPSSHIAPQCDSEPFYFGTSHDIIDTPTIHSLASLIDKSMVSYTAIKVLTTLLLACLDFPGPFGMS